MEVSPMPPRSRVANVVGRLLSGACRVLEGGSPAVPSMEALFRRPAPEGLVALRLCASDILAVYEVSACSPGVSLLQAIVGAIVALPELPPSLRNTSCIDRATLALLKRSGISGFTYGMSDRERKAPAADPTRLIEWAAAARPLAVPNVASSERSTLGTRQAELLEAVVLALLESNPVLASAGLRWLAVLSPSADDTALMIRAGVRRAAQLGADDPQTRFDCCLTTKVLESFC